MQSALFFLTTHGMIQLGFRPSLFLDSLRVPEVLAFPFSRVRM
jgi:hypothetical protein